MTSWEAASERTFPGAKTRRDSSVTSVNHASDQIVTGVGSAAHGERDVGWHRDHNGQGCRRGLHGCAGDRRHHERHCHSHHERPASVSDRRHGNLVNDATVTYTGKTPTTSTRREVITDDGSATAKLVITQDATTKDCTIPLPPSRARLKRKDRGRRV